MSDDLVDPRDPIIASPKKRGARTLPITGADSALKTKRKMRPGGGKSKGNGFEGLVAKTLTKALQPLNFMRTPGSGARVGGKNFETLGQMLGEDALKIFVGDVVPVNERKEGLTFKHVIECKSYATPDNFTSLASGSANVWKWYEEVVIDAAKVNKIPLLIFKWNRTPVFVAIDTNTLPPIDPQPLFTLLSYGEHGRALDIYYLDDLLKHPAFWYSKT
jgi:hypothetical protein